jgi:hypothetical protein
MIKLKKIIKTLQKNQGQILETKKTWHKSKSKTNKEVALKFGWLGVKIKEKKRDKKKGLSVSY